MIPTRQATMTEDKVEQSQPSKTWEIDFIKNRIVGKTDGLGAVRQAAFCALQTDRYRHLIYMANYGSGLRTVTGKSRGYADSEIRRFVQESLLVDNRITNVQDIEIAYVGDAVTVRFSVESTEGDYRQEVTVSV